MANPSAEAPDEFYVGYLPQAPASYTRLIKKVIIGLFLLVAFIAAYLVWNQKGFSTSSFEYGTLTEVEGILYQHPAPMLKIKLGEDTHGNSIYKNVLLVNFLKSGASDLVKTYEQKLNKPLDQVMVKLRGTLIYLDGITLMELTGKEDAFLGVSGKTPDRNALIPQRKALGEVTLKGEIVDPKCYFGVMKPGEAKPHRSCAIRCISGGIPPVIVVKDESGEARYLLVVDENGQAINKEILEYVAEPVQVKGKLIQHDDWYILQTNPQHNISRIE